MSQNDVVLALLFVFEFCLYKNGVVLDKKLQNDVVSRRRLPKNDIFPVRRSILQHFKTTGGGGGGGGGRKRGSPAGGRSLPRRSHLMSEVAAAVDDGVFGPTSERGERRTVNDEGQRRRYDDDDRGHVSS